MNYPRKNPIYLWQTYTFQLNQIKFDNRKSLLKIYWLQITDAFPNSWKDTILKDKRYVKKLAIFDHDIVEKSQIFSLKKLTSKELYLILVDANPVKSTA